MSIPILKMYESWVDVPIGAKFRFIAPESDEDCDTCDFIRDTIWYNGFTRDCYSYIGDPIMCFWDADYKVITTGFDSSKLGAGYSDNDGVYPDWLHIFWEQHDKRKRKAGVQ